MTTARDLLRQAFDEWLALGWTPGVRWHDEMAATPSGAALLALADDGAALERLREALAPHDPWRIGVEPWTDPVHPGSTVLLIECECHGFLLDVEPRGPTFAAACEVAIAALAQPEPGGDDPLLEATLAKARAALAQPEPDR